MRIISGKYKGRRIEVPHTFKARPTTDFAKENLFNVLSNLIDLEGMSALDLFSGTGSIGLEMLSRGCSRVVSVELDAQHHAFLKKVKYDMQLHEWFPLRRDVFRYLSHSPESFDLVFADPPYALKSLSSLPELVLQSDALREGGILILEHGKEYDFSSSPYFLQHRAYGSVNFSLFKKEEERVCEKIREEERRDEQ